MAKNIKPELSEILNMNQAIKHRGPDDYGILKYKNSIFGHVRLSVQDLSSKGNQPMSKDGNLWIVFNGEIYNFKEIRKYLEGHGYKFISQSDTEVILAAYDYWKDKCFEKFNGMWAFALLDKKKIKLKFAGIGMVLSLAILLR